TYLAETRLTVDEQYIVFSCNRSDLFHIPEDVTLPWSEGVCRFVVEGGPHYTSDAQKQFPSSSVARLLQIRTFVSYPVFTAEGKVHGLADLHLLAPLPNPRGNVIAIGRNYQAHAEESARAAGKAVDPPTVFTKAVTSVAGPHDDIVIDGAVTSQVDWEVELGIVIGRAGVNIARERASEHVFGYIVVNDVSARDVQFGWGGQYFKGKSLDGFCPTGPWIVTRDELDPGALRLSLRVNGETKQDASTSDMVYPVDAVIEWVSKGMTLPAGTIIATGTPDGVGFARTPPEF